MLIVLVPTNEFNHFENATYTLMSDKERKFVTVPLIVKCEEHY